MKVYFLRHGETVWNRQGRLQGQLDSPLTARGIEQVTNTGERLAQLIGDEPIRLIASPLGRCQASAQLVAASFQLNSHAVESDDRLQELCYGEWQGRTVSDLRLDDQSDYARRAADRWNVAPPGGETYRDVGERVSSWLRTISNETVVAIGHGCAGRILRAIHANDEQLAVESSNQSHGSVYLLAAGGEVRQVI